MQFPCIQCSSQHQKQGANGKHPCVAQVRARFVERFSMGAPYSAGEVHGPAITDIAEKVSWVEKFVEIGTAATEAARTEHDRCGNTCGAA